MNRTPTKQPPTRTQRSLIPESLRFFWCSELGNGSCEQPASAGPIRRHGDHFANPSNRGGIRLQACARPEQIWLLVREVCGAIDRLCAHEPRILPRVDCNMVDGPRVGDHNV